MKVNLIILLLIVSTSAIAQFSDSTNYFVNASATGIANKTNEGNSYLLNNSLKFAIYKQRFSLNSNSQFVYGEQNDNLSNRDLSSTLDLSVLKKVRSIYYWGLASAEKSYSLKINNRFQAGAGIGYNVVDRKNAIVILSDGLLYEHSNLIVEGSENEYDIVRNSFRLKFRFVFKERVTLDGTDFLQHSLEDKHNYIVKSNTSLSVKLWKWLSFTAAATYNKMSITKRENLLLNFGLSAEKYF